MGTEISAALQHKIIRKQYSRDFLLEVKKNASLTDTDVFDKLARTLINGVNRGNRNKNRSVFSKTRDNDRFRDSGGIILGPQKRIWNTGCHVSQSPTSDTNDNANFPRTNSRNDRSRGVDYKRDYRNAHIPARDRGTRRTETGSYRRPYCRNERYAKGGNSHNEEPEWFSEGPVNVSETIELGGIIDDIPELSESLTEKENKTEQSAVHEATTRADLLEKRDETQPCEKNTNPTNMEADIATESESLKHSGHNGSRFKHLFSLSEGSPTDTDAINRQLLQLLRGTSKVTPANPTVPRADVLQVERKLRAILLGHNDIVGNGAPAKLPDCAVNKPHVLTVEEIEAQLTPQEKPPQLCHNTERPKIGNGFTELPPLKISSPTGLVGEINNTGLLHTLMKRQAVCSQSLYIRNALNTLGMFSSPASRFTAPTVAASANACIRQIQNGDSLSQAIENISHTSTLHRLLECHPKNTLSSMHAASQPHSSNAPPQRITNLTTDIAHSTHSPGGLSALRCPILKANTPSGTYRHLQTPFIAAEDDGQCRIQNVKQQAVANTISQLHFGQPGKYSTNFAAPVDAFDTRHTGTFVNSSHLLTPGISATANVNRITCLKTQLPLLISQPGPMTFLPHMVNSEAGLHHRDTTVQAPARPTTCGVVITATPSGGGLMKVKTLEEIEQFELLGNNSYL